MHHIAAVLLDGLRAGLLHLRLHADVHGRQGALGDLGFSAGRGEFLHVAAEAEVDTLGLGLVAVGGDVRLAGPLEDRVQRGRLRVDPHQPLDLRLTGRLLDLCEVGLEALEHQARLAFHPLVSKELRDGEVVHLPLLLLAELGDVLCAARAYPVVQAVVRLLLLRHERHLLLAGNASVVLVIPQALQDASLSEGEAAAVLLDLGLAGRKDRRHQANVLQVFLHPFEEGLVAGAGELRPVFDEADLLPRSGRPAGDVLAFLNGIEVSLASIKKRHIELNDPCLHALQFGNLLLACRIQLFPLQVLQTIIGLNACLRRTILAYVLPASLRPGHVLFQGARLCCLLEESLDSRLARNCNLSLPHPCLDETPRLACIA
mmetsp:Transcript_79798/g.193376  ORF Transcript_79798/g.193376 Transcript_79798/m.193376 type:complete len:374 (-) Transcript_79798:257-1378(-)